MIHVVDGSSSQYSALPDVEIYKNQGTQPEETTDTNGDAKNIMIDTKDMLVFKNKTHSPTTIVFDDPKYLQGITVYMQKTSTTEKAISGIVTLNNNPCGLNAIYDLDNPTTKYNCDATNGSYKITFQKDPPYRIAYVINTTSIVKLQVDGNTNTKVDVAINNINTGGVGYDSIQGSPQSN